MSAPRTTGEWVTYPDGRKVWRVTIVPQNKDDKSN